MKIVVASDHGGFSLKETVLQTIKDCGHEALDFGTDSEQRVDFPDYAEKACRALQEGKADRAILMCGTGIGMCIAANKNKGVYASVCHDTFSAHQGVEHDGMNTLCLGGRIIGLELAAELVRSFLNAGPAQGGRYMERVNKFKAWEK